MVTGGLKLAGVREENIATFTVGMGWALSGSTAPAIGTFGGSFLSFDDASTESYVYGIGSLVPDHWRTFDVYLEAFNFVDGDGGDVVWQVNVNSGGDATTTVSYAASTSNNVSKVGGQTYSLNSNTVAGVAKWGATVVISRLGGDAADTFAGDIALSSLHVVRLT